MHFRIVVEGSGGVFVAGRKLPVPSVRRAVTPLAWRNRRLVCALLGGLCLARRQFFARVRHKTPDNTKRQTGHERDPLACSLYHGAQRLAVQRKRFSNLQETLRSLQISVSKEMKVCLCVVGTRRSRSPHPPYTRLATEATRHCIRGKPCVGLPAACPAAPAFHG